MTPRICTLETKAEERGDSLRIPCPGRCSVTCETVEKGNQGAGANGFSRKLRNHVAATALNYFAYNFIKIHRTLRMSPAMAAGVTDRLWDVNDLVALWGSYERRTERAA